MTKLYILCYQDIKTAMNTQAYGCEGECVFILKITINNVIYNWLRSLFRSQNIDIY